MSQVVTPTEVKRIFELLKIVKGGDYVLIIDLAKELGIRRTDLMETVLENPNIYDCGKGFKTGRAVLKSVKI